MPISTRFLLSLIYSWIHERIIWNLAIWLYSNLLSFLLSFNKNNDVKVINEPYRKSCTTKKWFNHQCFWHFYFETTKTVKMLSYSLIQPSSCQKFIRMLYINLNQESVPKEIFRDNITCDEISLQNEKLYIVE